MRRLVILSLLAWTGFAGGIHGAGVVIAWNDVGANAGMLGAISASAPWRAVRDPIPVGLNSVLHSAFGKLYVLSAADRTVSIVDPVAWTIEETFSLAPGDEPVDIKVTSPELAYITRRGATGLLQLNLTSGATHEVVDLGIFADSDGIPEQANMAVHEGRLFIQLQRVNFDEPAPFPLPYVAVVDLDSGQIIDADPAREGVQAIELEGTFPKTKMQVVEQTGKLFVSATGGFFDQGGIEVIDLDSLQSEGLVIREADDFTGADLGPFLMVGPDRGFLAYSTDLLLSSHLHQFSLPGGVDPAELAVALDYFSPAIEIDPGANSVFFPLGGSLENGLHVFNAATGARLSDQLIATSGPPTDLIVVEAVPEPAGALLALCWSVAVFLAAHGRTKLNCPRAN
jgi:hypothetical protein